MGFGYLGSYLVYGFRINDDECEERNERDEYFENFQQLSENGNIFIKEFGCEEDTKYFLCWKTVFRGGEYWDPHWLKESDQCKHTIDLGKMAEIENSYNEDEVRKVCAKYQLVYKEPCWQTLILQDNVYTKLK